MRNRKIRIFCEFVDVQQTEVLGLVDEKCWSGLWNEVVFGTEEKMGVFAEMDFFCDVQQDR